MIRSNRPDVRNPMLALPGLARFADFEPAVVEALAVLMTEYETVCRQNAETCWRRHKAPMASYWKIWAVNLRHARVALRRILKEKRS